MVLWGLTSASMLFVQGEWSFYVLRFMLGVFEAGFAPGMIFYLTYWYSQSRMAGVMAVVMLAGPIGGIVGGPMSAWIMTAFSGAHGLDGWQWMFLLEGLPCVLLGVIAFRYLDDKPAEARCSTPRKRRCWPRTWTRAARSRSTRSRRCCATRPSTAWPSRISA